MNAVDGGVAVVTGATGGMGRVIALELARRGMHVVTIARDPRRAEELQAHVLHVTGRAALEVVRSDLSTLAGITSAAEEIARRFDAVQLLINNAGAHFAEHRRTVDGIEMHIAVDYLAAYGLTALLRPALRRGRARVVNVASDTLRDTRRIKLVGRPRPATLDVDDLDDLARLNPAAGFVPFQAYARAKLLTVIAGQGLARSLAGEVTVNAVHPGIVATDIISDLVPRPLRLAEPLIRRAMLTPEEGAAAALRLALDPDLQGVTGRYFVRDTVVPTPAVSSRHDVQQRLRSTSDRFIASASGGGETSARPVGG
jgi:NAD(P)-dependent dehydrogenase (short-subunit alcohol dehydrogenase family)